MLSQGLAFLLLVIAVLAGAPTEHDTASTLWAAGVGGFGLLGLVAFYRALAIGTMSVVAPISATGVAIPVFVGLLSGERPGTLQIAGILLACVGVILAGREAPSADAEVRRAGRTAIGLALAGRHRLRDVLRRDRPRGGDRATSPGCCSPPAPPTWCCC